MLSDRKNPDYRNSIKESIFSIESMIYSIEGKMDFSKAIKKLNIRLGLHSSLIEGIIKLYGYTSDKDGIRHAVLQKSDVGFNDAKFMLVSCSNLINYFIANLSKKEII